jgi:chromate reductase, NAD(P)H dehydrogenase (quinone)
MARAPKILAFAGSSRKGSVNQALIDAVIPAANEAGAEVTKLDLRGLELPIYDGDLEDAEGLPKGCIELKETMKAHDGLLISCPEYNSSITPLLKNAVDWASRPHEGEKPLECFRGKTAGLVSASPGALGGLRGLVVVRMLLGNIGVHLLPAQAAVSKAEVDDAGNLVNQPQVDMARDVARELAKFTAGVIASRA